MVRPAHPAKDRAHACHEADVVLDAGSGNTANAHVVLDLAANKGTAMFSGGTGRFVGAQADVTADSDGSWQWRGTYSFD